MSAPPTARAGASGTATTAASPGARARGRTRAGRPDPRTSLTLAAALATALATLALTPLFEDLSWYPPSLLAIAVVAGAGWGVRRLGIPLPLHPVLQGAALVWLLVLLEARERAWGGLIPTVSAVADLRAVIGAGLATIEATVPPAPSDPAIVAIAALGVGLVALLVDVSAVPLRMPVLAGAPLLALYLVPAVVLRAQTPWWCFVVAAVGWLTLLLSDSRESLLAWGRVLGRQQRLATAGPSSADDPSGSTSPAPAEAAPRYVETTRTPGLSSAARRLGVVAVATAVVLPALVPGLTAPMLRLGQGPGADIDADGSGTGGPVTLNPLVSLKREYLEADDRVVIRYRSDDPDPDYLRMVALTEFDGTTWSPREFPADGTEVTAGLPPEVPGMVAQSDYPVRRYDIAVDRLDNRYLPLPFPPVTVAIGAGWRYEPETRVVYSTDQSSLGAGYVATAVDPTWTPEQLRESSVRPVDPQRFLRLLDASNAPPSVADTAKTVAAGATTPYDQAVALQNWFRSQFRYSTSVTSGNDANYLEAFLREKVGYCEQFAATMALMARTLGIPARVAVGFTQGTRTGEGTWEVTIRDAHAWPELWLEGAGWVRFEPTPRSDAQAGVGVPPYAAATQGASPQPTPTTTGAVPGGDRLAAARRADRLAENDLRDDAGGTGDLPASATSPSPWRWVVLGVLLLVGLALLVPCAVRLRRRRGRLGRDDPEGAWAELRDTVLDVGLPWSDAATPRRGAAALARTVVLAPPAAEALTRLVAATEAARYAPPGTPSPWTPDADVAVLRSALLAHVDARSRLRARWWPPTVVAGASAAGAGQGTGALRSDDGVALGDREGGSSARQPERLGV